MSEQKAVYVVVKPSLDEPTESFIEIEDAARRGVTVESSPDGAYRRIGPLYLASEPMSCSVAFAQWWRKNEWDWSWHLGDDDTDDESKARQAFEAGYAAARHSGPSEEVTR